MLYQRFIIRYGGGWDRSDYIGGDEQLICLSHDSVSYSHIFSEIHDILNCDLATTEYCLFYLSDVVGGGRKVKEALKNNSDIVRMISESLGDPIIYVVTRFKQPSQPQHSFRSSGPSISLQDDYVEEDEATSSDEEDEDEEKEQDEDEEHSRLIEPLVNDFSTWIRTPGQLDRYGLGDRTFSRSVHTEGDGSADDRDVRNWVLPLIEVEPPVYLEWSQASEWGPTELCVNSTFSSKEELEIAVGLYHMQHRVEYSTERSNTVRLNYKCKHGNGYPFMLRARQSASVWRVIKSISRIVVILTSIGLLHVVCPRRCWVAISRTSCTPMAQF